MPRTICIIDTSVLCEILRVPGRYDPARATEFDRELEARIKADEHLMLPWVTLLETGNHVGQVTQGSQRRTAATLFKDFVLKALRNETPLNPVYFPSRQELEDVLETFPDWATGGSGLGDRALVSIWERLQEIPGTPVYIWSTDGHLRAYDSRRPE